MHRTIINKIINYRQRYLIIRDTDEDTADTVQNNMLRGRNIFAYTHASLTMMERVARGHKSST